VQIYHGLFKEGKLHIFVKAPTSTCNFQKKIDISLREQMCKLQQKHQHQDETKILENNQHQLKYNLIFFFKFVDFRDYS